MNVRLSLKSKSIISVFLMVAIITASCLLGMKRVSGGIANNEIKEVVASFKTTYAVNRNYQSMENSIIDASYNKKSKTIFNLEPYWFKTAIADKDSKDYQIISHIGDLNEAKKYGYTDSFLDELQKKITTVSEVMAYIIISGYEYGVDKCDETGNILFGWNLQSSAKESLLNNSGACEDTAKIVCYLLEDDYEEVGFVYAVSNNAHAYNYVKKDGTYYLIDFTDFTASSNCDKEKHKNYSSEKTELYSIYEYFKDICFWSGSDLNDVSATKAVLTHDTYNYADHNTRRWLDIDYNKKNTGIIYALKYYSGMEGKPVSTLIDTSYNVNVGKNGFKFNNNHVTLYLNQPIELTVPQGIEYTVFWANYTEDGFYSNVWREAEPLEISKVPYFAELPEGLCNENRYDKASRQFNSEWTKQLVNDNFEIEVKKENFEHVNANEVKVAKIDTLRYNSKIASVKPSKNDDPYEFYIQYVLDNYGIRLKKHIF